jgi:hypothetical protein
MDEAGERRFTIFDAMVMVAATALGLALVRWVESPISVPGTRAGFLVYWPWSGAPASIISAWALALLVLRLVQPQGRRRMAICEPGTIAGLASLAAMGLGAVRLAIVDLLDRNPSNLAVYPVWNYWGYATEHAPEVVAGSWLALWLSGRWSAVPSWIDRTGRLLGVYWIAKFSTIFVGPILEMIFPGS